MHDSLAKAVARGVAATAVVALLTGMLLARRSRLNQQLAHVQRLSYVPNKSSTRRGLPRRNATEWPEICTTSSRTA